MRNLWLQIVGSSVAIMTVSGCMSVLQYHETDATTKTPYSGTKTDLQLAASAMSDPELRGTIPGFVILTMSTIDTPLSLVADTLMLPRDLRRSALVRRTSEELTE